MIRLFCFIGAKIVFDVPTLSEYLYGHHCFIAIVCGMLLGTYALVICARYQYSFKSVTYTVKVQGENESAAFVPLFAITV